jgi:hypothetical protein
LGGRVSEKGGEEEEGDKAVKEVGARLPTSPEIHGGLRRFLGEVC